MGYRLATSGACSISCVLFNVPYDSFVAVFINVHISDIALVLTGIYAKQEARLPHVIELVGDLFHLSALNKFATT